MKIWRGTSRCIPYKDVNFSVFFQFVPHLCLFNGKEFSVSWISGTLDMRWPSYSENDYSCLCAGKKNFMSVTQQPEKNHTYRTCTLCNLPEFYVAFCEEYPTVSTGLSKSAELWQEHCILTRALRTHTACICVIHQNTTLMLQRGMKMGLFLRYNEIASHFTWIIWGLLELKLDINTLRSPPLDDNVYRVSNLRKLTVLRSVTS
jgi:hypothetical protein